MAENYQTTRLTLQQLTLEDDAFIFELVNTSGWLTFIGDRNVLSVKDAGSYIQRIRSNPQINYWVVRTKNTLIPIGVVTFIKRDYLKHYDIGFAFLPQYGGQGFAFEAAEVVLKYVLSTGKHHCILATTLIENASSIKLLGQLGFTFEKTIKNEDKQLSLYSFTK